MYIDGIYKHKLLPRTKHETPVSPVVSHLGVEGILQKTCGAKH